MTYSCCELCPNECRVDRTAGQVGRCAMDSTVKIAWAGLHRGEEPPVSGRRGSGMIFFCGCPLHCQYCQNYQISQGGWDGVSVSEKELASIMIALRDDGAASINLVTGTHFIPSIVTALKDARSRGLDISMFFASSCFSAALPHEYADLPQSASSSSIAKVEGM